MVRSRGRPLAVMFRDLKEESPLAGQNWVGWGWGKRETGRRGSTLGPGNKCPASQELEAGQVAGRQMQRYPKDEARARWQAGAVASRAWGAGLSIGCCFGNVDTAGDTPHSLVAQE